MPSAVSSCFLCLSLLSKKIKIILEDMWNQYYYYFDLPKFRVGQAYTTKN